MSYVKCLILLVFLSACTSKNIPLQIRNPKALYISSAYKSMTPGRYTSTYEEVYYISSSQAAKDTVMILKYDCDKNSSMRFHIGDVLILNFTR